MRTVVNMIEENMVGVLIKVSTEHENVNMNMIEVSQTLPQGVFVIVMLVDIMKGSTTLADFAAHIENVGEQSGLTIYTMYGDVLDSMYKIQDDGRVISVRDILEAIKMIDEEYLNARIITMGTSLLDCCGSDMDESCKKIHNKITRLARGLVKTGEDIEQEYSIPIIGKWISVTPVAMLAAINGGDPVGYAHILEHCAQAVGINFIGGYSASVQKSCAVDDRELMGSIPRALAEVEHVYALINVDSTKAGIDMNAVELVRHMVKEAAELTKDRNYIDAAKLVVSYNVPEDNPFMTGTFHDVGEADCVINVNVSGPGTVRVALAKADKSLPMNKLADIIKKTALRTARMGQLMGTLASEHLGVPFGIADLSLAPTPTVGNSTTYILEETGLESCGAYGTTTCLTMLNDVVKKGGVMASNTVGGFSGAFISVSENAGMIAATRTGTLCLEELEAITAVYSVGLDMVVIPGETTPGVTSGIITDEAAIGMADSKTTTIRAIPATSKKVEKKPKFGGLLRGSPVTNISQTDCSVMIHRKRRIPVPIQVLGN